MGTPEDSNLAFVYVQNFKANFRNILKLPVQKNRSPKSLKNPQIRFKEIVIYNTSTHPRILALACIYEFF